MSISDKIFSVLEKNGFERDSENPFVTYKGLESGGEWTNCSLYFCDDEGKFDFGFWLESSVNQTLRNNLRVELHNVVDVNKCSDATVSPDEGGAWVYCTLNITNESIVDWLKSTMEELERRALFMINK
jgi:hypothetical protein